MKKPELLFNIVSVPVDALMLILAGLFSFYTRIHFQELVGPVIYDLRIIDFVKVLYFVIPVLMLIFALLGLYKLKGTRKVTEELGKIILGVSVGLFIVIIAFFFNNTLFPSRFIVLAAWGFAIIFLIIGRLLLRWAQEILFSLGYGLHNLVIINGANAESKVLEKVFKNKLFGYKLLAELSYDSNIINKLEELYQQRRFDEIIQTNPSMDDELNLKVVEFARYKGLQFSFLPNLFDVQRNVVEVNTFEGIPVISLKNSPLDGWGRVVKRILDILASSICLILASPLFLIIFIAIHLDSKGKSIYTATRVGKNKNFAFYKFRSMYSHLSVGEQYGGKQAEAVLDDLWKKNDRGGKDSPLYKFKADPRVTKVGRILRKTKLDELPQFFNVLKGDMSMVGPRAHLVEQVAMYQAHNKRVLSIKPGIFGVTQIAQMAWPILPFEEEIRLDVYYIENWSLWFDIKILVQSFWMIFFRNRTNEDY